MERKTSKTPILIRLLKIFKVFFYFSLLILTSCITQNKTYDNLQFNGESITINVQSPRQALELKEAYNSLRLGRLKFQQDRFEEAERYFKAALAATEKNLNPDHPWVAVFENALANDLMFEGYYSKAEKLYINAISLTEKSNETAMSKRLWHGLRGLASAYLSLGNYDKAEPILQRALENCGKTTNPDLCEADVKLGFSAYHRWRGHNEKAIEFAKSALKLAETTKLRDETELLGASLDNLAKALIKIGQYSDAEPLCQRALNIKVEKFGKDRVTVANTLEILGDLRVSQGNYEKAESYYKGALRIRAILLRHDHPVSAFIVSKLAKLYQKQGLYDKAKFAYEDSIAVLNSELGASHPEVELLQKEYASMLKKN